MKGYLEVIEQIRRINTLFDLNLSTRDLSTHTLTKFEVLGMSDQAQELLKETFASTIMCYDAGSNIWLGYHTSHVFNEIVLYDTALCNICIDYVNIGLPVEAVKHAVIEWITEHRRY